MGMRKLNVTVAAELAPALVDAILWAAEMARTLRDVDGNPPGSPYAAHRDALGLLHTALVRAENTRAPARTGKRWTRADDATLQVAWGPLRRSSSGTDEALQLLADTVQRTPVAVALRLQSLGIWR